MIIITKTMESKVELFPELIFDILSRLPVKSLLRFMCVSKSWCTLISSPQFIESHRKTSSASNRKLIFHTTLPIPAKDYSLTECDFNSALYAPMTEATNLVCPNFGLVPQDNIIEIIGSFNGLVCLAVRPLCTNLFLWNPSIRKYKEISHWGPEFKFSYLASYGFAYSELHDDYKVVGIIDYQTSRDPKEYDRCVKVYSHRTNSWNRIKDSENSRVPRNCDLYFDRSATFTNGKFHWVALSLPRTIVSFDLADETFGEIEHLPENMGEQGTFMWTTGVLGEGNLALLCQSPWAKFDVDVWIMTEYGVGESWRKVYSFRIPSRVHHCPLQHFLFQPLFVLGRGECLFNLGPKLVIYNPEDDSYKDLDINCNLRRNCGSVKVKIYDESLVLLDDHDG